MEIIARIYTDFKEKFGIPRQSGIVDGALGRIVFEKKYRNPDALRGIEDFSHLWILWKFSEAERGEWSPTVRPPRLGGNKKMGVFATRSPFRPNPIGLSSVRLIGVEKTERDGDVLIVSGVDMLDGTPIYDVKPYLAFTDSHPGAVGGFADAVADYSQSVLISDELRGSITDEELEVIISLLRQDPRPAYKHSDDSEYGMIYGEREIFFKRDADGLRITRIKGRKS